MNQLIETGQWETVLQGVGGDSIVEVSLNQPAENPFQHKYIVKYNPMIPPNCIMSIIFPLHPDPGKRILWTAGDLSTLSHEINARIKESDRDGAQIIVCSGDKFYRFTGNVGTVYLVWAERINQQTINRQETLIAENIPLLIELDRKWKYRSVFIFGNTATTALADVQAFDPFHCQIFCCETDPRGETIKRVQTVTASRADQVTSEMLIVNALDGVKEPFSE